MPRRADLLGYVPSYKGKLKRKEKDGGEPSKKASALKKKGGTQPKGGNKKGKEPRVKFPTFSKSALYWFKESQAAELPGINIPLRTVVPEFAEDMSRRNVVRVNIRDGASVRKGVSDPPKLAEKRQKVTRDFFPTKPPTPRPIEKEWTETLTAGGSKAIKKPVGLAERVVVQEFAPTFASADGRLVTVEDNVKAEHVLVVNMVQGLALPKDWRCRRTWRRCLRTFSRA